MGFWISPDGKSYSIPDHFGAMRAAPELFGHTKRQARSWSIKNRQEVIDSALAAGWIRVRGKNPHLAFEFWVLMNVTLFNIRGFLLAREIPHDERALLEEIATGASWYHHVAWILGDEALGVVRHPKFKGRGGRRR